MDKIWYIQIGGKEEGPFSMLDLKWDSRVTPDTLVRHQDLQNWVPIRHVKELEDVFKDEPKPKEEEELEDLKKVAVLPGQDTLTVDMRYDPSNLFLFIIAILAIIYVLFRLHQVS